MVLDSSLAQAIAPIRGVKRSKRVGWVFAPPEGEGLDLAPSDLLQEREGLVPSTELMPTVLQLVVAGMAE